MALEAWARRRLRTFQDAERGLCFGRLTLDAALRPLYVGRRWVHDDRHEVLVVNWQAPAARPFYTATPADPQRVTQRRRYRTEGRRLTDISDESLDGTAVEGASVSDFLLEELDRRREGRMRDIVATIQSDQYRLITAEPEGALVVQGGPGTGKTAVGLHRASWLLYTHREQLRRVLVVGPNPTFMDYVSHVLPALGEEAVEQRAVSELLDGIEVGREEAADVARLKADPRLADVVRRAVELAVRPAPQELVLYADGVFVSVKQREVATLLDRRAGVGSCLDACARALPHGAAAALLRALRRAARRARPAQLRRARTGVEAERLPHEVPRPRARAAEAGEARRAASDVPGRACARRRTAFSTATSSSSCCATGRSAPRTCAGASTTCRCWTRRAR